MRLTRVFTPAALHTGTEVALTDSAGTHLVRVLRLREGAQFIAFDGQGHAHHAELRSINGSRVTALLGEALEEHVESPLQLTLVQGISRGERMDWTLQKATELGISQVVPVITTRSVVKLDDKQADKKLDHWQNVVIGACEQSGRNTVPSVQSPQTLRQYLQRISIQPAINTLRLVLSPTATQSLAALTPNTTNMELLIGPEGGLSDEEISAAQQAGYVSVRLGPRILRTETAAVVALSVLQAHWGDLR